MSKIKTENLRRVINLILVLLFFVSLLFGIFLFRQSAVMIINNNVTAETPDNDGLFVTSIETEGVSLSLKSASSDEESNGEVAALGATSSSTYTVTATVLPSDATDSTVTMSVAWANASSTWATGKTVTDYVTVAQSSTGSKTGTITCEQAFGEQVILTVVSNSNSSAKATAAIDYVKRVSAVTLSLSTGTTFKMNSAITYTFTPTYGTGTLTGTMAYSALSITPSSSFISSVSSYLNRYMDGDYDLSGSAATIAVTPTSGSSYTSNSYLNWFSYDGAEDDSWANNIYLAGCKSVSSGTATVKCNYSYTYGGSTLNSGSVTALTVYLDFSNC